MSTRFLRIPEFIGIEVQEDWWQCYHLFPIKVGCLNAALDEPKTPREGGRHGIFDDIYIYIQYSLHRIYIMIHA